MTRDPRLGKPLPYRWVVSARATLGGFNLIIPDARRSAGRSPHTNCFSKTRNRLATGPLTSTTLPADDVKPTREPPPCYPRDPLGRPATSNRWAPSRCTSCGPSTHRAWLISGALCKRPAGSLTHPADHSVFTARFHRCWEIPPQAGNPAPAGELVTGRDGHAAGAHSLPVETAPRA